MLNPVLMMFICQNRLVPRRHAEVKLLIAEILKSWPLGQQHLHYLGTYQKGKSLVLIPVILNQKLWGQGLAICF